MLLMRAQKQQKQHKKRNHKENIPQDKPKVQPGDALRGDVEEAVNGGRRVGRGQGARIKAIVAGAGQGAGVHWVVELVGVLVDGAVVCDEVDGDVGVGDGVFGEEGVEFWGVVDLEEDVEDCVCGGAEVDSVAAVVEALGVVYIEGVVYYLVEGEVVVGPGLDSGEEHGLVWGTGKVAPEVFEVL